LSIQYGRRLSGEQALEAVLKDEDKVSVSRKTKVRKESRNGKEDFDDNNLMSKASKKSKNVKELNKSPQYKSESRNENSKTKSIMSKSKDKSTFQELSTKSDVFDNKSKERVYRVITLSDSSSSEKLSEYHDEKKMPRFNIKVSKTKNESGNNIKDVDFDDIKSMSNASNKSRNVKTLNKSSHNKSGSRNESFKTKSVSSKSKDSSSEDDDEMQMSLSSNKMSKTNKSKHSETESDSDEELQLKQLQRHDKVSVWTLYFRYNVSNRPIHRQCRWIDRNRYNDHYWHRSYWHRPMPYN